MSRSGLDPVTAQELTILPGIEEVLALLEVREFARAGHWDAVVVDCAPTAETLRLLALPEALDWYLAKVLPAHRRLARGARPIAALFGRAEAMPTDAVFAALLRLRDDLAATRTLLADPQITTVRLVLTPEAVVVAEARRTFTALALYGYRVDLVVANRVFPPGRDAFRQAWVSAQREQLSQLRDSFAGLPVAQVAYGSAEPIGLAALGDIARALYAGSDPADSGAVARPMAVEADGAGYRLRLWLPLAHKSDIDAARVGDDLVLTVAGYRRVLSLPSVLRRCEVVGARFEQLSSGADRAAADRPPGGELIVQFLPDPNLWPRSTETDRSATAGRDALAQEETRA
jgi:arsenite-transporting ATPase